MLRALEEAGIGTWEVDLRTYALTLSHIGVELLTGGGDPPAAWFDLLALAHPDDRRRLSDAMDMSARTGATSTATTGRRRLTEKPIGFANEAAFSLTTRVIPRACGACFSISTSQRGWNMRCERVKNISTPSFKLCRTQ